MLRASQAMGLGEPHPDVRNQSAPGKSGSGKVNGNLPAIDASTSDHRMNKSTTRKTGTFRGSELGHLVTTGPSRYASTEIYPFSVPHARRYRSGGQGTPTCESVPTHSPLQSQLEPEPDSPGSSALRQPQSQPIFPQPSMTSRPARTFSPPRLLQSDWKIRKP
jgi:hypothetical protein